MEQAAVLTVQNLSVGVKRGKTYLSAVDTVSFQLYPGEIAGIVGESGCGKTLTARSIPGLLPQGVQVTGGSIEFNGMNMRTLSPKELRRIRGNELSAVFQEPMTSLNPLLKIGRQIGEPLELHGQKDKRLIYAKTLEVMQKVGLPDPEKLAAAYPHQLSGGMRQRALIALAIIGEPKLLIADEPTTALDATIQAQILHLLKQINQEQGTAILFISHDLEVISRLCDRVLVMYAGKLVEAGTVQAVFSNPQHEYTKGLLGSIPTKAGKGKPLLTIPGKAPSIEEIAGIGEKREREKKEKREKKKKKEGCPFAPRCLRVQEECSAGFPDKVIFTAGDRSEQHYAHCRLASEAEYAGI